MALTLTSPAFAAGVAIPARFTCDGENLSPPLAWSGAPDGTRSFALVCDDPDAPGRTFVHWVLFDLPAATAALPEGLPATAVLKTPAGARQGKTDARRVGYSGPCPPPGGPHRYFFKLYACDALLGLSGEPTKTDLERALEGHVLAQAELMGTYGRTRR